MSGLGRVVQVMVVAAVLLGAPSLAVAAGWQVTTRGAASVPAGAPLAAEITADVPPGDYELRALEGEPGPARGRAQVFVDAGKTWFAAVAPQLPAGATRRFSLRPLQGAAPPGAAIRPSGRDLELYTGGRLLTVYRAGEETKPYYYPVIGPTGEPYTRAYPMIKDVPGEARDHAHQRSFWFTHGNVNGVDFWGSDPLNGSKATFGTIKETSRRMLAGSVVGVVRTTDDWLDHGGAKVLEDERVVRFYDTEATRLVDFDIMLKATSGPVTFGDTKEGMFGLRVASTMDVSKKKGGKITNAEGLHDEPAWGKPSTWVDYTGPVQGKTVGIAILNHPSSFRHPTTWHVRTYGLFAANPFGWHDFGLKKSGAYTIPKGESIAFRYRVVLHKGDTASADVAAAYRAYAEPPKVEVQAE